MQVDAAPQTRSAAELDAGFRETLPPVVAGDAPAFVVGERPETERKHEWPGSLFVILSYVAAVGLAAGAVVGVGWAIVSGDPAKVGWAAGAGLGAALQWRLAGEVDHFTRWGWYGAMAELAAAAATKVWSMAEGNWAGGAIGLVLDLLWMSYFWERRGHFDVDLGG